MDKRSENELLQAGATETVRQKWETPVLTAIEVSSQTRAGKYLNPIISENAWYHS